MKIIAENLIKIYGDRSVVNDVSFEVNKGEVVGLLGPNGAGKTTTFYMIVGLVKANSGKVSLLNKTTNETKDITLMPMNERARLGIGKQKKEKLEELLEEFGMTRHRKSSAVSLSGGERRRVEIARALAATPHFILLDEPFTGIDPIAIGDIKENIYKLAREKGLGVLITDHNPKATLSITDRAYVIFDGKIKIQGKSVDVANDPVAKEFYLGKDFKL